MTSLKEAAVELAKGGYWIFPCKPGTKEPAIKGYMEAQWSVEEVEKYWTDNPDANIALVPSLNELVVLDIDAYKDECNWDRPEPDTMAVRSARGGKHFYFEDGGNRFPGKFNGYKGVDIKHRGLVVLPPSRFEDGVYEWANDLGPAELPDWMPTKVAVEVDPEAAALMNVARGDDGGRLIDIVKASPNEIEDREKWLAVGNGLHWEYHGTALEDQARQAFIEWSMRWVGSDDREMLRAEAEKMWKHAKSPAELVSEGTRPSTGGTVRHLLAAKVAAPLPKINSSSLFRSLDEIDAVSKPWLVPGLIRVGGTHAVVGMSATGKTALSAGFIAAMLAGKTEVLGLGAVERPLNVAWANAEEDEADMRDHIEAAQHKHMLSQLGTLKLVGEQALDRERHGLEVVMEHQNPATGRIEAVVNQPLVDQMVEELKVADIDLMMIDPITEFNGGDENSRFHARMLNRAFREISRRSGVAVMYWAHTGKPPEGKRPDWYVSDLYAQRGSSQNIGAVQAGSTLTPFLPEASASEAWRMYNDAKRQLRPNLVLFNMVKMKRSPTLMEEVYCITNSELMPDIPVVSHVPMDEAKEMVSKDKQAADALMRANQTEQLVRSLGPGLHSRGAVNKAVGGHAGFPKDMRADRPESKRVLQQWFRAQDCVVGGMRYRVVVIFSDANAASFEVSITEVERA